jgi:hypothetical protein
MHLTTHLPKKRRSPRPAKPRITTAARESAPRTRDARRGSGPEDRALYSCMCGFAFMATVSTSVDCPHCGTEQAW